jgi:hypothetical protein
MSKTCGYQAQDGKIVSKNFDGPDLPEGWHDSPGAAKEAAKPAKRGRKAKAKNAD